MEILFITICVAVIAILYALSIGVWLSDIKKQMNSLNAYVTDKFSPRIIGYEAPEGTELRKAYHDDVCYDLYTSEDYTLTRKRSTIPTGVKAEFATSCFAFVLPRSGASTKGIPATCVSEDGKKTLCRIYGNIIIGTVDTGYRGELFRWLVGIPVGTGLSRACFGYRVYGDRRCETNCCTQSACKPGVD